MVTVTSFSTAASPYQFVSEVSIPIETICAPHVPQYTIDYAAGTPYAVGGNTFIPVKVSGTVTYKPKGSCCTKTKIFSEDITLAVAEASLATFSLTATKATGVVTDVSCCMAKGFKITSLLSLAFT